jgi:hypothetical protein
LSFYFLVLIALHLDGHGFCIYLEHFVLPLMLTTCFTLYSPLSVVTVGLCKPTDTMPGQPVLTGEHTMGPLRAGERTNTMRKLTILAVVFTLICGAVIVTAPAGHSRAIGAGDMACHQGSDAGSCDVVSAVRGSVRIANHEICQGQNAPVQCAVTSVAGLDRK